jgi:hypothetical protein
MAFPNFKLIGFSETCILASAFLIWSNSADAFAIVLACFGFFISLMKEANRINIERTNSKIE